MGNTIPVKMEQYCCNQFVIARDTIKQYTHDYYIHLYQQCRATSHTPHWAGRWFESTFNMLFYRDVLKHNNINNTNSTDDNVDIIVNVNNNYNKQASTIVNTSVNILGRNNIRAYKGKEEEYACSIASVWCKT